MALLKKFNQSFGLTPTESRVVLFLVITFLAGGLLKLLNYQVPSSSHQQFDYSSMDAEFNQRSQSAMLMDSINIKDSVATPKKRSKSGKVSKDTLAAGSVNLNTATKDQLVKLPGVGDATADRIIVYRDEHGKFKSVDDLLNVKGIGKKKLERIVPFVKVE